MEYVTFMIVVAIAIQAGKAYLRERRRLIAYGNIWELDEHDIDFSRWKHQAIEEV